MSWHYLQKKEYGYFNVKNLKTWAATCVLTGCLICSVMGQTVSDFMSQGLASIQNKDYKGAVSKLQDAYKSAPDGTEKDKAQFYLLKAYLKSGDEKTAVNELAALKQRSPKSPALDDALFFFAHELFENQGQYDKSKPYLDELLTQYPSSDYVDKALFQRMRVADREKDFTKVEECFNKLNNEHASSSVMAAATLRYAESLRNVKGDPKSAEKFYRKVVADYPASAFAPQAQLGIAELWNGVLKDAFGVFDTEKAMKESQKVCDKWPRTKWAAQAKYNQVMLLHRLSEFDLAKEKAQEIIDQFTYSECTLQYGHAMYSVAFIDYMQGKVDQSIDEFRQLIKKHPDSPYAALAYKQLAKTYFFIGKRKEAQSEIKKLIAEYPATPIAKEAEKELAVLNEINLEPSLHVADTNNKETNISQSSNLCGPAAIQLLLSHYGVDADIKKLAEQSNHTPDGTSFAGLANALGKYGFKSVGYKMSQKALTKMMYPVIVQMNHRQKDHFVVLEKVDRKNVQYSDYQGNHLKIGLKDFHEQWTGYVLVAAPQQKIERYVQNVSSNQKLPERLMHSVMGGCEPPSVLLINCPNVFGVPQNNCPPQTFSTSPNNGDCSNPDRVDESGVGGGTANSPTSLGVNMGNGWAHTSFPDFTFSGDLPNNQSISITRTYASNRHTNDGGDYFGNYGPDKPWGNLWTFNVASHLAFVGDNRVFLVDEVGNQYEFVSNGSVYKPHPRYAIHQWISQNGTEYTLNSKDGFKYRFKRIVINSTPTHYARLEKYVYPNNKEVTFEYSDSTSVYLQSICTNTTNSMTRVMLSYSNGKLSSISDAYNRSVNYLYDSYGNLTQIRRPGGYVINYSYNAYSQITAVRDSFSGSTNLYTYEYTGDGDIGGTPKCTAIIDCLGNRSELSYDGWWNRTGVLVKDKNNYVISTGVSFYFNEDSDKLTHEYRDGQLMRQYIYSYYDRINYGVMTATRDYMNRYASYFIDTTYGNLTAKKDIYGYWSYYEYDTTLNVSTCEIDAAGNKTYYEYNNLRLPTLIISPSGARSQRKYDSYGNLTCSIDPLGQMSESIYDSQGIYILMQISPSKATTQFYYDSWGRQTAIKDPKGYLTSFGYDTMNRLIWSRDALGGLTQTEYYVNGLVKKVTDANNNSTECEYDLRNRLIKKTDTTGKYTQYWYDSLDRTTCTQDQKGQKTYIAYDNWGRMSTRYYDTGTTYTYAYDSIGQLVAVSDPCIGTNHDLYYDAFGRTTSYQNSWGTTTYAYDTYGRRIGLKDPDGNTYGYYYDSVNRLFMIHNLALDQFTMYSYDSIGRRSMEIYPNGLITTYEFDTCGCGSRVTNNQIYKPTDNFNRTSLGVNWTTTGTLSIETNRLTTGGTALAICTMGGSFSDVTVESSIIVTDNASSKNGYLVHGYSTGIYGPSFRYAGYDHGSGVLKIGHKNINDNTIYVDISTTMGWASGIPLRVKATVSGPTTSLWMLEPSGYEKKLSYVFSSSKAGTTGLFSNAAISQFDDFILNNNTTLVARYAYDYDANGNRISVTDKNYLSTYYSYDSLNRLIYENRAGIYTRSYGYDSVGNRIWMYNGTSTTSYTYNNLNQLRSDGSNNYSYDSCGNLIQKDWGDNGFIYGWNENNMMINVMLPNGAVSYLYDSFGKRVQKDGNTSNGQKAVRYFYDGINVLLEKVSTQGSEAGWLNFQTQATYTLTPGVVGQIISVKKADGSNLFYHYDPIGNVILISDLSGDTIAGYYQEGFGNVMQTVGSADNNYHLTTKELDEDTGLYYFFARWYDPETGRFISEDPIWNVNLYAYSENNPIRNVDYDGMAVCRYPYEFGPANSKFVECHKKCMQEKHGAPWGQERVFTTYGIQGMEGNIYCPSGCSYPNDKIPPKDTKRNYELFWDRGKYCIDYCEKEVLHINR